MHITITDAEYQELIRVKREYLAIMCNLKDRCEIIKFHLQEYPNDFQAPIEAMALKLVFGEKYIEELLK